MSRRPLSIAILAAAACGDLGGTPPGWGAVFWREGVAYQAGGGPIVVGPRGVARVTPAGDDREACGGGAILGAVDHAVLAPPAGSDPEPPSKPPAVAAEVVEAAGWRLDEALPPVEGYAPAAPSPDPARQRGVEVGSVVKARRHGAPPIVVASGTRACTAALVVTDASAARALASARVADVCGIPRVLPPSDLDGDGARETALFTGEVTALFRLDEKPGSVGLVALGEWRCPLVPAR